MSANPVNLLNWPAELAQLLLKVAVAKYIEAAGAAAAMTARATAVKAIVTQVDQAVLGNITLQQLLAMTAAELQQKNISVSSQIAISGLLSILPPLLPTTGIGGAVNAAIANEVLADVTAVCAQYGA